MSKFSAENGRFKQFDALRERITRARKIGQADAFELQRMADKTAGQTRTFFQKLAEAYSLHPLASMPLDTAQLTKLKALWPTDVNNPAPVVTKPTAAHTNGWRVLQTMINTGVGGYLSRAHLKDIAAELAKLSSSCNAPSSPSTSHPRPSPSSTA